MRVESARSGCHTRHYRGKLSKIEPRGSGLNNPGEACDMSTEAHASSAAPCFRRQYGSLLMRVYPPSPTKNGLQWTEGATAAVADSPSARSAVLAHYRSRWWSFYRDCSSGVEGAGGTSQVAIADTAASLNRYRRAHAACGRGSFALYLLRRSSYGIDRQSYHHCADDTFHLSHFLSSDGPARLLRKISFQRRTDVKTALPFREAIG